MARGPGGRPPLSEALRQERVALGQRLRQVRETADLTQEDLAKVLGVHPRRISEWEAGERPMYVDSFVQIARVCGVTAAHILGEQRALLTTAA